MKEIDKILSDNGLKHEEWRNTPKQEDSVGERLKLAEKLKSTGFKIELDARLHKRK